MCKCSEITANTKLAMQANAVAVTTYLAYCTSRLWAPVSNLQAVRLPEWHGVL